MNDKALDGAILDILGGIIPLQGVDSGELTDDQYDKLFNLFQDHKEMPYGTMKARTGDPTVWILDRLEDLNNRIITKE
jgi:hypothetical protein